MKKILFISALLFISGCNTVTNVTPTKKITQTVEPTSEETYQSALELYNNNFLIQSNQKFLQASQQGHAKAQFRLAKMYYDGKGVDNNPIEAAKWYRKAAEQGHIEAQYYLGALYFVGGGGAAQSFSKSKQWYRKAAEQGHIIAQLSLGMMYYNGKGGQKDFKTAKKWLSLAAAQGNEDAVFILKKLDE
ncbi:MAG: sel1 repeat family protein [Candidatus Marithrix sp.]|nr:sel1 repeat family protein [Candidatus Marithrix sp.]